MRRKVEIHASEPQRPAKKIHFDWSRDPLMHNVCKLSSKKMPAIPALAAAVAAPAAELNTELMSWAAPNATRDLPAMPWEPAKLRRPRCSWPGTPRVKHYHVSTHDGFSAQVPGHSSLAAAREMRADAGASPFHHKFGKIGCQEKQR